MAIERGQYDSELEDLDFANNIGFDDGLIVAVKPMSRSPTLISDHAPDPDNEDGSVRMADLRNSRGRFRLHTDDPDWDYLRYKDQVYDDFAMAELAFSLWVSCGPFDSPEDNAIPVEVATTGQDAIAAYLRLGSGTPNSRSYVSEKMGVTEQTVSNYCQRIRDRVDVENITHLDM